MCFIEVHDLAPIYELGIENPEHFYNRVFHEIVYYLLVMDPDKGNCQLMLSLGSENVVQEKNLWSPTLLCTVNLLFHLIQ